jgi:hypothetical protein
MEFWAPCSIYDEVYATSRKVVGSRPDELIKFIDLPTPSGRNRPLCLGSFKQKRVPHRNKWCVWEVERGRCVRLTTSPPCVIRMSGYVGALTRHNLIDLDGLLQRELYFLYVDDARTSEETQPRASTACYGNSFTLLYVGNTPMGLHGLLRGCYSRICRWYSYLTGNTHIGIHGLYQGCYSFICRWCSHLTGNTHIGLHGLLRGCYSFICRWCSYLTGNTHISLHGMLRECHSFICRWRRSPPWKPPILHSINRLDSGAET